MRLVFNSLLSVALIAVSQFGCVSAEHRAFNVAQEEYEECLANHPNEPGRCGVLKDAAKRKYEEYEEAGQSRWGDREWRDRETPWGKD